MENKEIILDNIDFNLTCWACPEQYDVFLRWEKRSYLIWYIRLRHWYLYAEYYPNYVSENTDIKIDIYDFS